MCLILFTIILTHIYMYKIKLNINQIYQYIYDKKNCWKKNININCLLLNIVNYMINYYIIIKWKIFLLDRIIQCIVKMLPIILEYCRKKKL